jgi:exodeoxyribonuclease VII large subunit
MLHDDDSTLAGRAIFTVSRLNEAARAVLEGGLGMVWVEGEISNLARPASGHVYFTLKDAQAQIRCAMFRRRGQPRGFTPRDGMSVLAFGRVSLYTVRGDYQLIVESLEASGEGLLRQRFEALTRRLQAEGLFDPARKRTLPRWPRRIGVVTSTTGAAIRDVLTVLRRRCPAIPVIVYPTAVQGEGAAAEIAAAIACANRRAECDVLIVGRGGGPVVSAVGHEVDVTIADFVADLRAATPSAAAELVSPDVAALVRHLRQLERRLAVHLRHALGQRARELGLLCRRLVSPRRRIEQHMQRLDELRERLPQALDLQLRLRRGELRALRARLDARSPRQELRALDLRLVQLGHRLHEAARHGLERRAQVLARLSALLAAVGPQATLDRGYAIVTDATGRVIKDAAGLAAGDRIGARLARGVLEAVVDRIQPAAGAPADQS